MKPYLFTVHRSTLPSNQPSAARVATWIKDNALLAIFCWPLA